MKRSIAIWLIALMIISTMQITVKAEASIEEMNVTVDDTEYCEYNGHYYKLIEMNYDFSRAGYICNTLGGHLATITSQEEQDFVYNVSKGKNAWLGASLINSKWTWVTGVKFNQYTNWCANEPSGGNEIYLGFYKGEGGWNDYKNTEKFSLYVNGMQKISLF